MTTTVRVIACCDPDKTRVEVQANDGEKTYLSDQESGDFYVYDDRTITVKEVPKQS